MMAKKQQRSFLRPGSLREKALFPLLMSRWGRISMTGVFIFQFIVLQNQNFVWEGGSTSENMMIKGQDPLSFIDANLLSPGDDLKYRVTKGIDTYGKPLINTTSLLHWQDIVPFATNVKVGQFCLPWSRGQGEADVWWTHHPDWEPFNESDLGYCFQPVPNPTKREYLTQVYQHQFHTVHKNCSNIFVTTMWSSGWSADITNLVNKLHYAMFHGQVMQVTSSPWHYAAPDQAKRPNKVPSTPACPLLTMYCYFLNLTSCTVQDPNAYNREYDYQNPLRMPPRATKWLPDYIVRPQTWLRHKVYLFVQKQQQKAIPPTAVPCTVMHVRRGDVLLHGKSSRRYHAISEYLNSTAATTTTTAASPLFQIHRNILLLTDDANAIVEAQQLHPEYRWMFIDRPRWKADEGGWEHQVPSSDPIFEIIVLLGTFALVQQCQSLVYSTSGFSNWILYAMEKKTDPRRSNIGHYNLDDAISYERGRHNSVSKAISTTFETPEKGTQKP